MFYYEYKDSTNILFDTEIDTIAIELSPNQAPITVKIFLRHMDEYRCNDFTFYRVANTKDEKTDNVKIEVIQSGLGFDQHPDGLPPILHKSTNKTDLKHLNGTISMARNEPGSASSEIFIFIDV